MKIHSCDMLICCNLMETVWSWWTWYLFAFSSCWFYLYAFLKPGMRIYSLSLSIFSVLPIYESPNIFWKFKHLFLEDSLEFSVLNFRHRCIKIVCCLSQKDLPLKCLKYIFLILSRIFERKFWLIDWWNHPGGRQVVGWIGG